MNLVVSFGNTFLTLTLSVLSLALLLVYLPPQGLRLLRVTTVFWPLALLLIAASGGLFAAAPYLWAPLLTLANMTNIGGTILLALIAAAWNRSPGRSLYLALGIGFAVSIAVFEHWRQAGAATYELRVYVVCLARAAFTLWMTAELHRFNRQERSNQVRLLVIFGALYVVANLARAVTVYFSGDGATPNLYAESYAAFVSRIFIAATQVLVAMSFNNYFVEKLWRQERDASLHHQRMFESSPAAGVIWDDRWQITGWNAEASRLFGWTPNEVVGRDVVELLFHPDRRQEAQSRLADLQAGRQLDARFVIKTRTKDGRWIDCEWTHRQIPRRSSERLEYVSLALDVSERLARERQLEQDREAAAMRQSSLAEQLSRSERELRGLRNHFAIAVDAADMGIWVRDVRTGEVLASPKWREIFGFGADEELTRDLVLALVHPDDQPSMVSFGESLRDGARHVLEYRIVRRDGAMRSISSWAQGEKDARGELAIVRSISLDITERKQAEFELRQQRREVAHLSRVVMLGELSGALAHELNQPLTAILSNAETAQRLLARDPVDVAEMGTILAEIVSEDLRASEVIRRLRHLLATGEVQRQRVDMNELIADTLKLLRSEVTSQQLSVTTDLQSDLPPAWGDRVQLQQVLINLVTNAAEAVKDLPPGERQVVVRTRNAAGNGSDVIQVSVVDHGRGLPAGDSDQVFRSFYSTKPGGMGLGLSICRTIVQAGGGRIWAENNAVRGASLHFTVATGDKAAT